MEPSAEILASARSCNQSATTPKITRMRERKPLKKFLEGISMLSRTKLTRLNLSTRLVATARSQVARRTTASATRMVWRATLSAASASIVRMRSHAAPISRCWIALRRYSSIMKVCRRLSQSQRAETFSRGSSSRMNKIYARN